MYIFETVGFNWSFRTNIESTHFFLFNNFEFCMCDQSNQVGKLY